MSEMNLHSEKIEAYLSNKLSGADKALFEDNLAKDPLFKNEVDLQNDIIEALKNNRKAQLKQRLNNIDLSSGSSTTYVGAKFAASVLVASLIGGGMFYYFSGNGNKKLDLSQVVENKIVISENANSKETSDAIISHADNTTKSGSSTSDLNDKKNATVLSKNSSTKQDNSQITAVVPDGGISSSNNEELNSNLNVNVPDGSLSETSDTKIKGIDVEVVDKNKKELSYQYYSNKLFLYGDFTSNPYQLLEMNTNKSKRLFINFDGKYFELKDNQTKVTRLKEVKDEILLKQLFLLDNK